MIINVGDTILGSHGRTGEVINIGIATEPNDIAAENDTALNAKTYDTELGYTGAVTYSGTDMWGKTSTWWCYLNQVKEVVKQGEKSNTDWMNG